MALENKDYEIIKLKIEKELGATLKDLVAEVAEQLKESLMYAIKDLISAEQQKMIKDFIRKSEFDTLWKKSYEKQLKEIEDNVNRKAILIKNITTIVMALGGFVGICYGVLVKLGVL